ncbi:MAG: MarR family transcriptional regulator [Candidatus Dormibacteria bacterium]
MLERSWRFVSNHGIVLVALGSRPQARIRELATLAGVSERACQAIVNDLVDAGYLVRRRVGRRSHYTVNLAAHMRHPALRTQEVRELMQSLSPSIEHSWAAALAPTA